MDWAGSETKEPPISVFHDGESNFSMDSVDAPNSVYSRVRNEKRKVRNELFRDSFYEKNFQDNSDISFSK